MTTRGPSEVQQAFDQVINALVGLEIRPVPQQVLAVRSSCINLDFLKGNQRLSDTILPAHSRARSPWRSER